MRYLIALAVMVAFGCAPEPKILTIDGHKYIKQDSLNGAGVSLIHSESCPCKEGPLEKE